MNESDMPNGPRTVGVEACGLTKVFHDSRAGTIVAADGVTFRCVHGEVFGLLGPNGAGKSTTLRMLATVLHPTSGTGTVAGHDILTDPLGVRRSMGYLSASTGLYGRLTARETLQYFGRLHGMDSRTLEARVRELLDTFGMADFADVRCEKLSTGMRQKVSIARTVVHDPPILILDEPTVGLDILVASTMIRFVEDCRARGKCIVFSTHIMSEAERLCGRIAVIHRGRIHACDTLDRLRESTGHRYLEDIFVHFVEGAERASGARA